MRFFAIIAIVATTLAMHTEDPYAAGDNSLVQSEVEAEADADLQVEENAEEGEDANKARYSGRKSRGPTRTARARVASYGRSAARKSYRRPSVKSYTRTYRPKRYSTSSRYGYRTYGYRTSGLYLTPSTYYRTISPSVRYIRYNARKCTCYSRF